MDMGSDWREQENWMGEVIKVGLKVAFEGCPGNWQKHEDWFSPRCFAPWNHRGSVCSAAGSSGLARCLGLASCQSSFTIFSYILVAQEQGTPWLKRVYLEVAQSSLFHSIFFFLSFWGCHVSSSSPPLPSLRNLDFLFFLSFPLRKSTFQ